MSSTNDIKFDFSSIKSSAKNEDFNGLSEKQILEKYEALLVKREKEVKDMSYQMGVVNEKYFDGLEKIKQLEKKNGKTIIYTTAEEDELSPTMKAFYFCDKSKQILSDKDSGEFKKNFESAYPNPFMKDINEDNSSYNSGFIEKVPVHNVTKVLSKKRKISSNINNPKSNKKKKVEKTNR